jgi:hypothetical protein
VEQVPLPHNHHRLAQRQIWKLDPDGHTIDLERYVGDDTILSYLQMIGRRQGIAVRGIPPSAVTNWSNLELVTAYLGEVDPQFGGNIIARHSMSGLTTQVIGWLPSLISQAVSWKYTILHPRSAMIVSGAFHLNSRPS